MKRILSFLFVVLGSVLACGQGQLNFNNTSTTLISTNGTTIGPTSPVLGGFVYALFVAPSNVITVAGVTDPNWLFTGVYATNTASAGRLAGGKPPLPAGYPSGDTDNFIARGWSTTIAGQDWPAVQAFIHTLEIDPAAHGSPGQFFGTSSIATITIGGPPSPVPTAFGPLPGAIPGFTLDQVRVTGQVATVINVGELSLTPTLVRVNFFVTSGSPTNFNLLQASQPSGPWSTNAAAVLTTNVPGSSYALTAPRGTDNAQYYRVQSH